MCAKAWPVGISGATKVRAKRSKGHPFTAFIKTLADPAKPLGRTFVYGPGGWLPVQQIAAKRYPCKVFRVTLENYQSIDLARGQKLYKSNGKAVYPHQLRGRSVTAYTKGATIIAAEQLIGRSMRADEWLYVKNGDITDCHPNNLEIVDEWVHKRRQQDADHPYWRVAPRYEVKPVTVYSVEEIGESFMYRVASQPYFANGILLAG